VVTEVASILGTLATAAESAGRAELLRAAVALFVQGRVTEYLPTTTTTTTTSTTVFRPLNPAAPRAQLQLLSIFKSLLAGALSGDAVLPSQDEVLKSLLGFARANTPVDGKFATSALQCLGVVVNHMPAGEALDSIVRDILESELANAARDASLPTGRRQRAVEAVVWLAKSLIMRGHACFSRMGKLLCELLGATDAAVAEQASDGFDLLFKECPGFEGVGFAGSLYKQRFFHENLAWFLARPPGLTPAQEGPRLMALGSMLRHLPASILDAHLATMLPILFQSVASELPKLRLATLQTLSALLVANPACLNSHLSTAVPRLLKRTGREQEPNMHARYLAALCLESLSTLPYHILFPYKDIVCDGLAPALDDPKRVVRKQAVRARNEWYVLADGEH
jgi:DNA repair/transcription protein MET18/MMS19